MNPKKLRQAIEWFGAAMHKLGQEEVRHSLYLGTAIQLAEEARAALWVALAVDDPSPEQRLEWVAAALHGDPLFGPGTEEPLVKQVYALRAQWSRQLQEQIEDKHRILREYEALRIKSNEGAPNDEASPDNTRAVRP